MNHATSDTRRQEALDWLHSRINYESQTAIPYNEQSLKLDRARELARRFGEPQNRLKVIHVAGTKGKGSTAAMIAHALGAAGHRVGLYCSPHLDRLEERFVVDGEPCSAEELIDLVSLARAAAEAMDLRAGDGRGPTFFDLTTVMALRHFADRGVDVAVVEVGLGGRLDSTNIVAPAVSVITSISRDHTHLLGDTLEEIAAEKAGIIKAGAPVVSGVTQRGPARVIERIADEQPTPLFRLGVDFQIERDGNAWRYQHRGGGPLESVHPAQPGESQARNAAVALATLALLDEQGIGSTIEQRLEGVANGRLPARMERFERRPIVVIDGAHNDASAEALADAIETLCHPVPAERRVLVVAMSADKQADEVLRPLLGLFDEIVVTRFLDNPRAAAPEELAERVRALGREPRTAGKPAEAIGLAERLAGEEGAVVVAGSLLFAAEARRVLVGRGTANTQTPSTPSAGE